MRASLDHRCVYEVKMMLSLKKRRGENKKCEQGGNEKAVNQNCYAYLRMPISFFLINKVTCLTLSMLKVIARAVQLDTINI